MSDKDDDLGLETLLAVRESDHPAVDEQLLRHCYAIQKKHQFDRDRAPSSAAMERLIDAAVTDAVDIKS